MQLIDTHAHLYLSKFQNDRAAMLDRARTEGGISHIFLPNIDSASIAPMLELEAAYPHFCYAMMGLHPCDVKENFEDELKIVESWLAKRKFCAIGEIGLDLYWDKTFFEQQKIAFIRQMRWAQDLKMPIVIHSRESTEEILQILEENQWFTEGGILHCYSGTVEQAQRTVERGFLLGIGGVLTYKKTNLPEIVRAVGLQNLVLETDAPFLAPEPYRGKRNESAYVRIIAEKLAQILDIDLAIVAKVTTQNALSLFLPEGV
jgi:TatD DNase family protein